MHLVLLNMGYILCPHKRYIMFGIEVDSTSNEAMSSHIIQIFILPISGKKDWLEFATCFSNSTSS